MNNKSTLPKNNYTKYYTGIDLITGQTILTTSMNKLSAFLSITRITVYRKLNGHTFYVGPKYIISVTDMLVKQDKGDYRRFRDNTSIMREAQSQIRELYKQAKEDKQNR